VGDVTTRIRRVTDDLRILQEQLDLAAHQAQAQRDKVLDELVDGDLMNDLKSAVDNVRHFLWAYIEATTQNPDDLKSAIQGYRMQRVTEMLRVLREHESPEMHNIPEARSFFEEINSIAHATVERYNKSEKGDGAASGKP
jgi:predicted RecB family endonuclease